MYSKISSNQLKDNLRVLHFVLQISDDRSISPIIDNHDVFIISATDILDNPVTLLPALSSSWISLHKGLLYGSGTFSVQWNILKNGESYVATSTILFLRNFAFLAAGNDQNDTKSQNLEIFEVVSSYFQPSHCELKKILIIKLSLISRRKNHKIHILLKS